MIAPSTIGRVRDAAEIVGEVERHVSLRRAGKDFIGLCPFHVEKTPSFHVSPERGRAHCFGCGWDGDVFCFIMAVEKCTFPQGVRILAARYGVALDHTKAAPDDAERRQRAESAAWELHDRIVSLKRQAMDRLHRAERLCARIGAQLRDERDPVRQERLWDRLARIAPAQTRFLAEFEFLFSAKPATLARFALATPAEQRKLILEGESSDASAAA